MFIQGTFAKARKLRPFAEEGAAHLVRGPEALPASLEGLFFLW